MARRKAQLLDFIVCEQVELAANVSIAWKKNNLSPSPKMMIALRRGNLQAFHRHRHQVQSAGRRAKFWPTATTRARRERKTTATKKYSPSKTRMPIVK